MKEICNKRLTLRQGDCPSSMWFRFAVEPLIQYLEKKLSDIMIYTTPIEGPTQTKTRNKLPRIESRYKIAGYCDDVKPAINSEEEFEVIDKLVNLFEGSSGCLLHRDPSSNKCKILLLGN